MTGRINGKLQAILPIRLLSPVGTPFDFEVMLDSGFNGFLALPEAAISRAGGVFRSMSMSVLADGSIVGLRKFEVTIEWMGAMTPVLALETRGGPLLGMSLMLGHDVRMEVRPGGTVKISPLSDS